jgi:ribosomal protein S18 acetylase RimI-like enzyme
MRPTNMGDAQAVGALWQTVSKVQGVPARSKPEDIRHSWQKPDFDLTSSSRVIVDAQKQLIAYGAIWDQGELPVQPWFTWYVHPKHYGQGIEDCLLDWMEQTAERVIDYCPPNAQIAYQTDSSSTAQQRLQFLESRGYKHVRNFYRMLIEMKTAPPAPNLAEAFVIRSLRYPDELEVMSIALDAIFKDHWGYIEVPVEEEIKFWEYELSHDSLFDPTLYFLAFDKQSNAIAGVCVCRIEQQDDPETAYIQELGILRDYRRQGLALAMLHHAFGEFWRRGRKKVALHVDASSLTGAT